MKSRISHQFLTYYIIVFLLSILAALFALTLMSFAGSVIAQTLMKNNYPAALLMRDDYKMIDTAKVIENGGGVQVVSSKYEVLYSKGLDLLGKEKLTASEFTRFLTRSDATGLPYHIDIEYNEHSGFWLIVTFPTSIRIDFALVYNKAAASREMQNVTGALVAVIIFYLLLLALFATILSKITSVRITTPLNKLCESARRLRSGDYAARVELKLKNEFKELQDAFNEMAERIEIETALRKEAEENRKKLVLDVSHDLKNPLASISGYAELCLKKKNMPSEELENYLAVIDKNAKRANMLIGSLFELSKVESPEFRLKTEKTDVCEFLRQLCAEALPRLEREGFLFEFDIPDESVFAMLDKAEISRVFHNLIDNALRYNKEGTKLLISLTEAEKIIVIKVKDDGIGIPKKLCGDIFKAFVRADDARNSQTGGTGLGLSIAQKIVNAHGGEIKLISDTGKGCEFIITLPSI